MVGTGRLGRKPETRGDTDMPMACVLGEIDLVAALGLAGVRCAVFAVPGDPARFSRATHVTLDWYDPWEEPDQVVASLIEFAAGQQEAPVLYYNGDHELLLVSRFRDRLDKHFRFLVPDRELVEDLVDKSRFDALARRIGLPVPPSRLLERTRGERVPDVELSFPVVVKPVTRRDARWRPIAAGKAVVAEDPDRFKQIWDRLEMDANYVVQPLVVGPESRIESYHVFAAEDGTILGEFTGRKLRTHPTIFGDTTALETTARPDVVAAGRAALQLLGLVGVAKFDFKRDEDDKLHLLEVNPRFNLWHHAGALAGVNLPAIAFAELTGRRSATATLARPGVTWCHVTKDLRAARAQGWSPIRWMRFAARADARWSLPRRDLMPFIRGVVLKKAKRFRSPVRS